MDYFMWFYKMIGSGFCHQISERTIYLGKNPLPLCARDTGIYMGVVISSIYIYFKGRFRAEKPPRLLLTVILCLMMLPMMFDGITSYLRLRETNNTIRIFSGIFFGITLPFFVIPLANYKIYGKNKIEVLLKANELLLLIMSGIFAGSLILYTDILPWILISSIIISGLIFLIGRVIFTLVYRSKIHNTSIKRFIVFVSTLIFIIVLILLSNKVLRPLI